jgi:hypothetical protein
VVEGKPSLAVIQQSKVFIGFGNGNDICRRVTETEIIRGGFTYTNQHHITYEIAEESPQQTI